MFIGDSDVSKNIDNYCIEILGIPGVVLMENAALKVLKNINLNKNSSFVIICGKGNNGGDGFAIGRHLITMGKRVDFFLIGGINKISGDARVNFNILKNMNVDINIVSSIEDLSDLRDAVQKSHVVIDAIFGTGLTRNVEGIYEDVISIVNENSKYTISVDVPSGMESNTGKILGICIKANKTISFVIYKKGFINYVAKKFTGDVIVENIGVPKECITKFCKDQFILDKNMVKGYMKKRDVYGHKGDFGRVLIVAGSKGFTGAAYISTMAAVKSGAGLVTLCTDESIQDILSCKLVEAMTTNFSEEKDLYNIMNKSNSIALGPGMGNNKVTFKRVKDIIENSKCPLIIDADGLNVLKDNLHLLECLNGKCIITPHLGEMATLTGLSIDYIKENRIKVAQEFAKKHNIIVLLKGYNTVITDGYKIAINSTGNSAMASGGMGDCLTGIIASFIGQGYEPMIATCISAFIHGYCGEKLSHEMFSVDASTLLNNLPKAINEMII